MKNRKNRPCSILATILLFLDFCLLCVPALAADNIAQKEPYRIPRVTDKAKIDGDLDDSVWQDALKFELNYEVWPGENITPPVKTEVLLAYNKTYLYVAFRALDENPAAIRATIHDRDSLGTDDWVGLILDPFNDAQRTFDFFCTPRGIQADMIESAGNTGGRWDAIWESAGKITDWGYAVEMAIPFSSLRFQRVKGDQVWRIDAVRSYPRNVRHHIGLFPRDRNNNCYMCQSEQLIGFTGVSPSRNIEIDPTLSAHLTQEREFLPDGDFVEQDKSIEPGMTARWGISPNLTLSAAVNPDFSNVEADVAQLDINKQFALRYPEKRPFFLEGTNIFESRYIAVHTRSLADPDWGIKLTGKEGVHSIGFFSVYDHITNFLLPGSQGSRSTTMQQDSLGTVFRYRRDIGKSSNIGFLITDREGQDYFNRVAGFDGDIRFTRKDRLAFQFLGSQTQYPDALVTKYRQPEDDFWGGAFDLMYIHDTRNFAWLLGYQEITADFRGDLGFMAQVDYRNIRGGVEYKWFAKRPQSWFNTINVGINGALEKDHGNNLLYSSMSLLFTYSGPAQSTFQVNGNIGKRGFSGFEFDENYIEFIAGFHLSRFITVTLSGKYGDQIDLANVKPGSVLALSPAFQVKLGNHLSMNLSHDFETLDIEGGRLYTANLSNFKLIYQFNKRTFLRTIFQFANHRFTSELYPIYVNPKFQHLFSQILFSYKINPQTVLFIGYADDYFGQEGLDLTQNNRTIFIKLGYALLL